MKHIIPILIGLLILATACSTKIECSSDEDCLMKHLDACKEYTITNPASSEIIVSLNGNVQTTYYVTGEKQDSDCGLKITIDSVTNDVDSWAMGKSMICYTTLQKMMTDGEDDLVLKSCSGELRDKMFEHCGPRQNSDGTMTNGHFYCDN